VVLGSSLELERIYTPWDWAPDTFKRRHIVYCPEPARALSDASRLRYRKVIVHWTGATYDPWLAKRLSSFPYVHVTLDGDLLPRLPKGAHLLTPARGVNWWIYNDLYPGLGVTE
jgi:hypothetical protein